MATTPAKKNKVQTKARTEKFEYPVRKKLQDLEDRIGTCETVLENDFSEQLGRLIERRTESLERIQQAQADIQTNKRYMVYSLIAAGILIITAVLVNANSSPQYRYVRDI